MMLLQRKHNAFVHLNCQKMFAQTANHCECAWSEQATGVDIQRGKVAVNTVSNVGQRKILQICEQIISTKCWEKKSCIPHSFLSNLYKLCPVMKKVYILAYCVMEFSHLFVVVFFSSSRFAHISDSKFEYHTFGVHMNTPFEKDLYCESRSVNKTHMWYANENGIYSYLD